MPAKKNAYFYFVQHFREDQRKNFNKTFRSFEDASNAAGGVWSSMSKEERDQFLPKNLPINVLNKKKAPALEKKYTSQGKPLLEVEQERRTLQRNHNMMKKYVLNLVENAIKDKALHKLEVFIAHASYYCEIKGDYHHAEFAISKFSLVDGVIDKFHTFLDPGPLPIGTTSIAMQQSEREHRIPLPGYPKLRECVPITDDYASLFRRVRKFAEKSTTEDGKCIMYSLEQHHRQTENMLRKMYLASGNTNKDFLDYFGLYDLHELFFQIGDLSRRASTRSKGYETVSIPMFITEKDEYDSWNSIACEYHVQEDVAQHCSKSIVTRLAFYICKDCCGYLDIKLQRGTHYPRELPVVEELPARVHAQPVPAQVQPARPSISSSMRSLNIADVSNPTVSITQPSAWNRPTPVLKTPEPVTKPTNVAKKSMPLGSVWGKPPNIKNNSQRQFDLPNYSDANVDHHFPSLNQSRSVPRGKPMSRGGKSAGLSRSSDFSIARDLSDDDEPLNPHLPHNDLDYAGLKRPNDNDSDFSIEAIDESLELNTEDSPIEAVRGSYHSRRNDSTQVEEDESKNENESFAEVRSRVNPTPSEAWPTNTSIGHLASRQRMSKIAATFSTPLCKQDDWKK